MSIIHLAALSAATLLALPAQAGAHGAPLHQSQAKGDIIIDSFLNWVDGVSPYSSVTLGPGGTLYITASAGCDSPGCVLALVPQGSWYAVNVVYAFPNTTEGYQPVDAPQLQSDGSLILTTLSGGPLFTGTINLLVPHGSAYTNTILHTFQFATDGGYPIANLASDHHGGYVGVTAAAGDPVCGCGVVYRLRPSGSTYHFEVIHAFLGGADGAVPADSSTPIVDKHGIVYGTTPAGGVNSDGVVYALVPGSGRQYAEKILRAFSGPDGANPNTSLVEDGSGNLFGTTSSGGANGLGAIFELSPSGLGFTESVLHSFSGPDGSNPSAGLSADGANLYGTTYQGGTPCPDYASGCGAAFEFNSATRKMRLLHIFAGGYDGELPLTTLTVTKSAIFGTTRTGGLGGNGVVYELPR